ncbi:hypothetical protein [Emcibacter sp.]|uniref:hypothetical protein n=1 Tax=Emcibacter sp. TaxID=1979954 RepID=UPI003A8EA51C
MQNRYFGDIGDYGKYSLLRNLCGVHQGTPDLSLGVVWYLFPDEGHNDDGKHISYLGKPEFRSCDPDLYDALKHYLSYGIREVKKIHKSRLFPEDTIFYDKILTYEKLYARDRRTRLKHRDSWILKAVETIGNQDVIFLDPDNGLEVKSVPIHAPKAPKYVFWDELEKFHSLGKTLVVYHHLNRTLKSREQIAIKLEEFQNEIGERPVIPVLFKRGSHRVFFVIPSENHEDIIKFRVEKFAQSSWAPHVEAL